MVELDDLREAPLGSDRGRARSKELANSVYHDPKRRHQTAEKPYLMCQNPVFELHFDDYLEAQV